MAPHTIMADQQSPVIIAAYHHPPVIRPRHLLGSFLFPFPPGPFNAITGLGKRANRLRGCWSVRFAPLPPPHLANPTCYCPSSRPSSPPPPGEGKRERCEDDSEDPHLWYTKDEIENFRIVARNASVRRRRSFLGSSNGGGGGGSSETMDRPGMAPGRPNATKTRPKSPPPPPSPINEKDEGHDRGDSDSSDESGGEENEEDQDEEEDETSVPRGLEHRVSRERQYRKALATKCVLEFQRRQRLQRRQDEDEDEDNAEEEERAERLARFAVRCSAWARNIALATGQSDFLEVYPRMARSVYASVPPPPLAPAPALSEPPAAAAVPALAPAPTPPAVQSRKRGTGGGGGDDNGRSVQMRPDPELRDFLRNVFTGSS